MALVDLKTILKDAYDRKYAVLAANLLSKEMIKAGIHTAEKLNSPLILQIAPVQFESSPLELVGPMMVAAAKNATVPVCVHLDHGQKIEEVIKAIEIGFSSVMIDASRYDFEENIKRTKEVALYAHKFNVSVEAELGSVGNEGENRSEQDIMDNMTKSQLAKEFVARTNCDALAIGIGNAHGPYVKYPKLDFNRLSEIHDILHMPLVLHGGSGTSEKDFKEVISRGISKINVATAIHNAAGEAMKNASTSNYFETVKQIEVNASAVIETHMKIFGSEGKA